MVSGLRYRLTDPDLSKLNARLVIVREAPDPLLRLSASMDSFCDCCTEQVVALLHLTKS